MWPKQKPDEALTRCILLSATTRELRRFLLRNARDGNSPALKPLIPVEEAMDGYLEDE